MILDKELERMLIYEISSYAHWDVLRFYLGDGPLSATLDELAVASGRDTESLVGVAGALVSRGWLSRRVDASGQTLYWLTQEQSRQELAERLRVALLDRTALLEAMRHWAEGDTQ